MHLELTNITKTYPGVRALDNVNFDVLPGEVHGLVGENGAGKSTLVRIIGGVVQPDEGAIRTDGMPVVFSDPEGAQESGVVVINQELEVLPSLPVTENVLLGRLPTRAGVVNWQAAHERTASVLETMDTRIDPRRLVGELSMAERRLVSIAQAIASDARLLVMDEPTAGMSDHETDKLLKLVERLRGAGKSIVYVSHRLSKVIDASDRISVLRDGNLVQTVSASETTESSLMRSIVGREVVEFRPTRSNVQSDALVLEVLGLSGSGYDSVSFDVRAGEVHGLFGLLGSGVQGVARALLGAPPATAGEIRVEGRSAAIRSPFDARRVGIGLVPSERREEGLILPSDVMTNVVLANLERYTRKGRFLHRNAQKSASSWASKLSIKAPSVSAVVANLSGGNQQKVVLARWMEAATKILILEEPTRGIDVGAKVEIHRLIAELCDQGVAVLLVSSELPELLAMSDRVTVLGRGQVTGSFEGVEMDRETLMSHATV